MGMKRKKTSEEMINDYIDRQLAKTKDADKRIQSSILINVLFLHL